LRLRRACLLARSPGGVHLKRSWGQLPAQGFLACTKCRAAAPPSLHTFETAANCCFASALSVCSCAVTYRPPGKCCSATLCPSCAHADCKEVTACMRFLLILPQSVALCCDTDAIVTLTCCLSCVSDMPPTCTAGRGTSMPPCSLWEVRSANFAASSSVPAAVQRRSPVKF